MTPELMAFVGGIVLLLIFFGVAAPDKRGR